MTDPHAREMPGRITHYPYLRPAELRAALFPSRSDSRTISALLRAEFGKPVVALNAARTGIYLALAAHGIRRWEEVIVPRFLSQCVLNTINKTALPATRPSEHTRAVLLLHQFGYPQHVEDVADHARGRGWLVIENGAHTMASRYRGRTIGTFGDAAVFSFPKLFPTILGGCLVSDDERIVQFASSYLGKRRSGIARGLLSQVSVVAAFAVYAAASPRVHGMFQPLLEMAYSEFTECPRPNAMVAHLAARALRDRTTAYSQRRRNLAIFKEYFLNAGYPEHLEKECDVVPFLVPYFSESEATLTAVAKAVEAIGIETGVYHFDVNRNMLDPNYQKCVPIPAHQRVSDETMHRICRAIAAAAKNG